MQINSSRRIGGVEIRKTETSTQYHIQYLVRENELETYTPDIGSEAEWAPAYAYVVEVTRTWIAEGAWLLKVTAEPRESSGFAIRTSGNKLNELTEKAFYPDTIHFKPSWWGIRIATHDDCTPISEIGPSGIVIPENTVKYLAISNSWAVPGDYIYRNATPLHCSRDGTRLDTELSGSADYSLSPFEGTHPLSWIDQDIPTRRYECTFATYQKIENISAFYGISGRFGNQCSPCSETSRKWKALEQTLKTLLDANGRKYTLVKRKMLEAPQQLVWDQTKLPAWIW